MKYDYVRTRLGNMQKICLKKNYTGVKIRTDEKQPRDVATKLDKKYNDLLIL